MFEIVLQKFRQNNSIAERLLGTNNQILVETNYWHDNYWGSCECENCKDVYGMNNLGFVLMHVRFILMLESNMKTIQNNHMENVKNESGYCRLEEILNAG